MSYDLNVGTITGRLTKDWEVKQTNNGKTVAKTSIAVNKDKESSNFFNLVAFGKSAEALSQYSKKGHKIAIQYTLNQNRWQAQDGTNRQSIDLIVNGFTFIQPREKNEPQNDQQGDTLDQGFGSW